MTQISHDLILEKGWPKDLNLAGVDTATAKVLLRRMLRLRKCEQALMEQYPQGEMRCPVHFCVGQEATSAALSAILRPADFVFSHHRSHGFYLAKHAPMKALFAELFGKETGANRGFAGSQEISKTDYRFFSGAILAGATSIAVGAAFAVKHRGEDNVVVAGFGEAATDEGAFWEAISYATLKSLPMIFVCENNKYSTFSPQKDRQPADNLHQRVAAWGIKVETIFGNDALQVYRTLRHAVHKARETSAPCFIQAYTYRWNGHVGPESDDHVGYRTEKEINLWKQLCPVALLKSKLEAEGIVDEDEYASWNRDIDQEIAGAFEFSRSSEFAQVKDWESLNYEYETPLADKLLADENATSLNQLQKETLPEPY